MRFTTLRYRICRQGAGHDTGRARRMESLLAAAIKVSLGVVIKVARNAVIKVISHEQVRQP